MCESIINTDSHKINKIGAVQNVRPMHSFIGAYDFNNHPHPSSMANRADLCASRLERDFADLSRNLFAPKVDPAIARKSNISLVALN